MCLKFSCIPVLDRYQCCCCCCSLKTATIVIGCLETVLSSLHTVWYSVYLLRFNEIGRVFWFDSEDLCVVLLSIGAVLCLSSLMLLCGVCTKIPGFMVLNLCVNFVRNITVIVGVVIYSFAKLFEVFYIGLSIMMAGFAVIGLLCYMWTVQYSYYRTLIQKKKDSKTEKIHQNISSK